MKIIKFFIYFLLSFILMISCNNDPITSDIEEYLKDLKKSDKPGCEVKYAKGFSIDYYDGITKINVKNPLDKSQILNTYYLVKSDKLKSKFSGNKYVIQLPLERIAVFSGTQISSLLKLGHNNEIIGVSEANYITIPKITEGISKGSIVELASNGEFYVETALKLNPDLIFYSPYNVNESHPLAVTNILMVPYLDFKETTPLGRAEWIKFNAAFFGEENMADSIFNNIESSYNHYVDMAKTAANRPSVLSDKPFAGQWYVPGGKSYIAQLFKDAGADYIWKDDNGVASFPLDYELVFKKAVHADFWRIVGSTNDKPSYEFLEKQNELFTHFDAFKNKKIIWCDARNTAYFEKGPLEPQVLLADLIYCFHPELMPDYQPVYYFLLN
ncbi:MAG: hypothetical protein C0598_03750 [Marinilabiliales bacterium]|nr:MAG: hypothetical protein C0598_03750 [Marinilabiliales bacterium]